MREQTMKLSIIVLLLAMTLVSPLLSADENKLSVELQDEMAIIRIDDVTFTSYRFGDGQKYPYFYPVAGPESGVSLTTESSLPYPHHRSLFFGLDRVNGGNYWQEGNERGQIISRGPLVTENSPDRITLTDICDWKQPGKSPIIQDSRVITVTAPSDDVRIIDFSITLHAIVDINVQKSNHALFSARMDARLSVEQGGALRNSEGGMKQEGTNGKNAAWADYFGSWFGATEGLAIFDSPDNLWYPCTWLTRDYGFFSPTPMNWLGDEGFNLKKGEELTLKYRVVVHTGSTEQAGIGKMYEEWAE